MSTTSTRRGRRPLALAALAAVAALALTVGACGNDDPDTNREQNHGQGQNQNQGDGQGQGQGDGQGQGASSSSTTTTTAGGDTTEPPSSTGSGAPADAALVTVLRRAVEEERHAEATYRNVIAALGEIKPFTTIVESEAQHVATLEKLAAEHGVDITGIDPAGEPSPATKQAACALGVSAEEADIALYDELLPQVTAWPDVEQALENLRAASADNHLPAFERCA